MATSRTDSLFGNFSFHLLWSSTLASGFGDRMAMLATYTMLGINLAGVDKSSITSGVDFFFFLPYVLWGPLAGWLADRLPRKWLMFAADELRGIVILFAFTLVPAGHEGAVSDNYRWQVYGMMLLLGVLAATFNPARTSVIPNVVGYLYLQRANAVVLSFGVIGNLLGFLIGGPILKDAARACVLIAALSYIVSGLFWIFLKAPRKRGVTDQPIRPIRQLAEGFAYIHHHHPVRVLVAVSVVFWSGTAVVMAASTVIADDLTPKSVAVSPPANADAPAGQAPAVTDDGIADEDTTGKKATIETFALIAGLFGAGMLAGSIILGALNSRIGGELLLIIGLVGAGVSLLLLVIVPFVIPVLWLTLLIALLTGVFGGMLMIAINTMLQQFSPDGIRGRVFGAKDMASTAAKVAVSGVIWIAPDSDRWMIPVSVLLAVCLAGMGVYGFKRYVLSGPHPNPILSLMYRVNRLYAFGFHGLRVRGAHHAPLQGGLLIVSNHTAGIDPALIQAVVPRVIHWMMGREFMTKRFNWLWKRIEPIAVDRLESDPAAARTAIAALRRGEAVGIFPEGGLERDRTQLRDFIPGVGLIARRGRAMILPVFISETPKCRTAYQSFYRPSRSRVVIGRPFHASDLEADDDQAAPISSGERQRRLMELIRRRIDELRDTD